MTTDGRSADRCSTWPTTATSRRSSSSPATRPPTARRPAPSGAATVGGVRSRTARCRSGRASSSIGPPTPSGSTAPSWSPGTTSPPATSCSAARAPSSSKGYAVVLATVQRVGIDGFPTDSQGLAAWDPTRYGSLSIPTDDASYDIYTQVARAVGPNRDRCGRRPARRARRRARHRHGRIAVGGPPRDLRERDPSARTRLRRLLPPDLLRVRHGARGRRCDRQHQCADHVGNRVTRRSAGHEHHPRGPRCARDGGQLRTRGDRVLRGPPARHRSLQVLGIGRHVPCLHPVHGRAHAQVRARVRHATAGDATDEPHRDHAALRRRAAPPQPLGRRRGAAARSSRSSSSPATPPRSCATSTASRSAACASRRPTRRSRRTARSRSARTSTACCGGRVTRSAPPSSTRCTATSRPMSSGSPRPPRVRSRQACCCRVMSNRSWRKPGASIDGPASSG